VIDTEQLPLLRARDLVNGHPD